LITPYRDNGHLNRQQKKNQQCCFICPSMRREGQCPFKRRFRRLQKVYNCDVKDICKLVMSCCILHNICIICDDDIEDVIDVNQSVNVTSNQIYLEIIQGQRPWGTQLLLPYKTLSRYVLIFD
jgi:hypothetical protein